MQTVTYVVSLLALLAIAGLWIRFTSRRRRPDQKYLGVCCVCCGLVEIKGPSPRPREKFVHVRCTGGMPGELLIYDENLRICV